VFEERRHSGIQARSGRTFATGDTDGEKRVASQHDLPLDGDIRMDPVKFRVALPAADPPDN